MRDLVHTTGKQLGDMRDALAVLLDHEHHINPRVVTDLCVMREQITAELERRVPPARLRTVDSPRG
jgi:hypothetical protein